MFYQSEVGFAPIKELEPTGVHFAGLRSLFDPELIPWIVAPIFEVKKKEQSMTQLLSALSLLVLTTPLFAHHSAATFDLTTPIVIKGVIAGVRFANPHSSIFMEVVAGNGEKQLWAVENSGTLAMTRLRGPAEESLLWAIPLPLAAMRLKRAMREELSLAGC
jgi:hypothetical protein